MADSIERLFNAVTLARSADPARSRTAKLLRAGRPKMVKKLAEEATEVVIGAMGSQRESVIRESADLLYHLVVLWADMGLRPADVWEEMTQRERLLGLAEKVPKDLQLDSVRRNKVVPLGPRPVRKR